MPVNGEIERRAGGTIRVDPSGDRKLTGHAIVFNRKSLDLGGFKEIILPEAVERTLSEALDVRALVDHEAGRILGRTRAGTLRLRSDGRGLAVEIHPPNTTNARDILESIDRGDVSGMSFSFRTLKDDWRMEDGEVIRDVSDMRMHEVSIVSFPAYPDTDVHVAQRALHSFMASQRGKHSRAWWERWQKTRLA
jgi:hypothetical protein